MEGYYDPFWPDVEGGFVFPRIDLGMDTETVVAASVLFGADSADLSISKLPDLPSDFDSGPGKNLPPPSPPPANVAFNSCCTPVQWV